jgi:hypothetical protein
VEKLRQSNHSNSARISVGKALAMLAESSVEKAPAIPVGISNVGKGPV